MRLGVSSFLGGAVCLALAGACSSTPTDAGDGASTTAGQGGTSGSDGSGSLGAAAGSATKSAGAPHAFLGAGQPPGVSLKFLSTEKAVLWSKPDICPSVPGTATQEGQFWISDGPPRAYRDAAGSVRLVIPHHLTYTLVGDAAGLASGTMTPDCGNVSMRSDYVNDPNQHDDASWLWSPYRLPDGSFVSLNHNEFHGGAHGPNNPFCPSGDYVKCWRNSITLATSSDGVHFARSARGRARSSPRRTSRTCPTTRTTGSSNRRTSFRARRTITSTRSRACRRLRRQRQHPPRSAGAEERALPAPARRTRRT